MLTGATKIMNLKRIADGIEQRSKHAAIKVSTNAGLSREDAELTFAYIQTKAYNLKGGLRKFYEGVTRWVAEDQIDITDPTQTAKLNKLLFNLKDTPQEDFYDKNFNGNSFADVVEALSLNLDAEEYKTPDDTYYEVFELTEEDLSMYEGLADWCILDPQVFAEHTKDGRKFYVAERSNYQDVPKSKGERYPYDDYGLSLIAISTQDGEITSTTSRWNFDDTGDSFLKEDELKSLLGDEFHELKL